MVELNEKAEEVVFCPQCGWNSAMDGPALPTPDDGLEVVGYAYRGPRGGLLVTEEPWKHAPEAVPLVNLSDAQAALQSKDEQIERLKGKVEDLAEYEGNALNERDEALVRAEAAEQQVQKLTAENERLREEQASKIAEFRDKVALGASPDEILRFRDGYPNPAGGSKVFYRHTIEQARYRYADAILAARTALETQEGGE